jgi:hypothetical protein
VTPTVVLLGNLLVDDLVFADSRTRMSQAGGAILYAAVSARLWGAAAGCVSVAASDYPQRMLDTLASLGVNLDGVRRVVSGLAPLLWIAPWLMILRRWEAPGPGAGAPATSNRFAFASSFGPLRHPTVLGTWAMTQACCTKRLVGTVSDIQNFGGNVAGIIAPWLTGAIAHRTGSFAPAFVLCGFILVAGALAYWWLMNERVSAPEEA